MDERSEAILKWTTKATRPLWAPDSANNAEHVGSCVLLRIHDTCFALTAAHVLDSIADKVLQVQTDLQALDQVELAVAAEAAVLALRRGDVAEFKRRRAFLQSKIGHLR